jgi:hypothetical protein
VHCQFVSYPSHPPRRVGLTRSGLDVLQSYVDRTGDVQTATILASCVCPSKLRDTRADRWAEAYRELLDGFKLHHHRVSFDISRGEILQSAIQSGKIPPMKWATSQILIRCNYCNKSVSIPGLSTSDKVCLFVNVFTFANSLLIYDSQQLVLIVTVHCHGAPSV